MRVLSSLLLPFPLALILVLASGCAEKPTRTPTAPPVEYDAAAGDEGPPIPAGPGPRRIETH